MNSEPFLFTLKSPLTFGEKLILLEHLDKFTSCNVELGCLGADQLDILLAELFASLRDDVSGTKQ